jgi:hypothetical protein
MSLDPVALVVLGWAGANVSAGAGKYLQDRVYQRLAATLGKASGKSETPIEASDRVKAKVFGEAAFTDDDITLEYLAGVLAASGPEDDAGSSVVAQIARLSADQLLFHYVVYRELRRLWPATPLNLYQQQEARGAGIRIQLHELLGPIAPGRFGNVVGTLIRERLLDEHHQTAQETIDGVGVWTVQVRPTGLGAELFLWGHGAKDTQAGGLFDGTVLPALEGVPATPSTTLLSPPALPEGDGGT